MVLQSVHCISQERSQFTIREDLYSVSKCVSLEEDPEVQRTDVSQHQCFTTVKPRAQQPAMPRWADIQMLGCDCNSRLKRLGGGCGGEHTMQFLDSLGSSDTPFHKNNKGEGERDLYFLSLSDWFWYRKFVFFWIWAWAGTVTLASLSLQLADLILWTSQPPHETVYFLSSFFLSFISFPFLSYWNWVSSISDVP